MKKRSLVSVLVLILCISTVAFAQAEDYGSNNKIRKAPKELKEFKHFKHRSERGKERFFTDEQREAIKKIRVENQSEAKSLRYKMKELKARQETLVNADKPDMKAINTNIDEITKLRGQLDKIQIKQRIDILALLTDEQKLRMPTDRKRGRG